MIEPWERVESERQGDYKVFHVRADQRRSPRSGQAHTFYVIEATDWVNIIPITPEGQVVCIRQYRHGTEVVTLEVPGGMVDAGETPAEAARREMREETGYDSDDIVYLGAVAPNPALQNNRCHSYLAPNVRLETMPHFDSTEDIEVVLVDLDEIPALIVSGQITHALVVSAFYLMDQHAA